MTASYQPTPSQRVEQVLAYFVHRRAARRANEAQELLQRAVERAQRRVYTGEPLTGFSLLQEDA